MSRIYESLKSFIYDVESFLLKTLRDVDLSNAACCEKDTILKKLKAIQDEYPQLRHVDADLLSREREPTSATLRQSPRRPEKEITCNDDIAEYTGDSSSIYSAIGDDVSQQDLSQQDLSTTGSCETLDTPLSCVSANEAFSNCVCSGPLIRKNPGKVNLVSKILMIQGKKFCIVKGGLFYVFEKHTSKKPASCFPLQGYEARLSAEQPSKKEVLFEINCPGQKSYIFAGTSSEDVDRWISVINSESLKAPVVKPVDDDDSSGSDYEHPDEDPVPRTRKATPAAAAADNDDDDDEFYDECEPVQPARGRSAPTRSPLPTITTSSDAADVDDHDDLIYEVCDELTVPSQSQQASISRPAASDYANMYYGRWDSVASDDNELSFRRGDILTILSRQFDQFGWWVATLNGNVGIVPKDYVTPAYQLLNI